MRKTSDRSTTNLRKNSRKEGFRCLPFGSFLKNADPAGAGLVKIHLPNPAQRKTMKNNEPETGPF
jgi:hypothetical protein